MDRIEAETETLLSLTSNHACGFLHSLVSRVQAHAQPAAARQLLVWIDEKIVSLRAIYMESAGSKAESHSLTLFSHNSLSGAILQWGRDVVALTTTGDSLIVAVNKVCRNGETVSLLPFGEIRSARRVIWHVSLCVSLSQIIYVITRENAVPLRKDTVLCINGETISIDTFSIITHTPPEKISLLGDLSEINVPAEVISPYVEFTDNVSVSYLLLVVRGLINGRGLTTNNRKANKAAAAIVKWLGLAIWPRK